MIPEEHTAYVGIGSNMGNKLAFCRQGIHRLAESDGVAVISRSRYYKTTPVDYTDQDWFVNAAVGLRTRLSPEGLLDLITRVEREAGRDRSGLRYGPRTLDIDILFYDDWVFQSPRLTIPHPRMDKRRFVLRPLCDIAPDKLHPLLHLTVSRILESLQADDQSVVPIISTDGTGEETG